MKTQRKRDTKNISKKPEQQSSSEPDSDIKILDSIYFSYFKSKKYYLLCTNFQHRFIDKNIDSKRKKTRKKPSERPKKREGNWMS